MISNIRMSNQCIICHIIMRSLSRIYQLLDFEFFGLQNGNQCHCGNTASRIIPVHPSNCNKRCDGNKTQFCGGSWRMNIFTTNAPDYPLIHITGSILPTQIYNDDITDKNMSFYTNFKKVTKKEIETLLESNPLIVDAFVSELDVEKPEDSKRRKRSIKEVIVDFTAVCSVRVSESFDMDDLQFYIRSSIQNANPNLFESFDEESFSSFDLFFEKPQIIKMNHKSKDEIVKLIGMFFLWFEN